MTPGQLIRTARLRNGLSQRRLATRAGTSQAWVSRAERDEISPTAETLSRVLLVLGEELALNATRLRGDRDHDPEGYAAHRELSPGRRLEHGIAAASLAAELRGKATRA